MLKNLIRISLLSFLLIVSACEKGGKSSSGSSSFLGDDTDEAVKIIDEANDDLREIKKIYIDNQGKAEEISAAINDKNGEKVKEIADNLVTEINNGLVLGDKAVTKIDRAKSLNINPKFRTYLDMKAQALRTQLEAFGFRLEAAQILRDGFGKTDKTQIEKVIIDFKNKDANFQKLMEDGRSLSQEANVYAAENTEKVK